MPHWDVAVNEAMSYVIVGRDPVITAMAQESKPLIIAAIVEHTVTVILVYVHNDQYFRTNALHPR